MKIWNRLAILGSVVAITVGGVAIASATTRESTVQYTACLDTRTKTLSDVTVNGIAKCAAHSQRISWNSQGPAGIAGTQGPAGPQGPAGAQGLAGPQGATGAQGPASARGPAGAQGATGAQGPTGARGLPGIPGTNGSPGARGPAGPTGPAGAPGTVLGFAEFYALLPPDDATTIASGTPVGFPENAPVDGSGTIFRSSPSSFVLSAVGTYEVTFQVPVNEAGQLGLSLNGSTMFDSVVGNATGSTQLVGETLVTTNSANSVLSVINAGPTALTLTTFAGGGGPVTASLVIKRLN